MNTTTTPTATEITAAATHAAHVGIKGFATETTLRRSAAVALSRIAAEEFAARFSIVKLPNGRVVPALIFSVGTLVPTEAIDFAFVGILVFQVRA